MTKETKQQSTNFSAQYAPEQSPCVFHGRSASLPHSGWAAGDGNGVPRGSKPCTRLLAWYSRVSGRSPAGSNTSWPNLSPAVLNAAGSQSPPPRLKYIFSPCKTWHIHTHPHADRRLPTAAACFQGQGPLRLGCALHSLRLWKENVGLKRHQPPPGQPQARR